MIWRVEKSGGLRQRKKAATRRALHESALRLVLKHGCEAVTVEEIADAAEVSRRTFSNYFSSKEEAVLYGHHLRLARLLDLIRARPADEPATACLSAAAEQFVAECGDTEPLWPVASQALLNSPTLICQLVNTYAGVERGLSEELVRRLPDEPAVRLRARVLAATYLTTLRVAVRVAIRTPDHSQAEILRQALRIVSVYPA
jgi:AcrR family transcriptional regulator